MGCALTISTWRLEPLPRTIVSSTRVPTGPRTIGAASAGVLPTMSILLMETARHGGNENGGQKTTSLPMRSERIDASHETAACARRLAGGNDISPMTSIACSSPDSCAGLPGAIFVMARPSLTADSVHPIPHVSPSLGVRVSRGLRRSKCTFFTVDKWCTHVQPQARERRSQGGE